MDYELIHQNADKTIHIRIMESGGGWVAEMENSLIGEILTLPNGENARSFPNRQMALSVAYALATLEEEWTR
jgi:hypothetical protein